ncbi:MAG: ankyrin repeat domain-containing protein, partial [Smithella sp.]
LIRSGANINEPDKYGITPLMHSIYYRHTDMAKYFIESGANVNARDSRGYSSLLYAVESDCNFVESIDIIKLLLKKGADVNTKDKEGETAIDLALSCARSDIFDDLTGPAFNLWIPETGKARVFFICNDLYDHYVIVTAGKQHKILNRNSSAGVAFIDVDPGKNIIDANFNKSVSTTAESIDTIAGQTYYFMVKQSIVNRFVPSFYLPADADTKDFTLTHLKEDSGKRGIIDILRLWRENPEVKIKNRHNQE